MALSIPSSVRADQYPDRESPVLLGGDEEQDNTVAFVVDSYILLRYVEIESAIRRALLVLKLRGGDHAKDIRQYEITGQGIEIMSKFEGGKAS